jgi:Holliday junction resolvase RusA-like endonuclease
MARVTITVPDEVPPSVNHYKDPIIITGRDHHRHISFKTTDDARAFKQWLAVCARGKTVVPGTDAERRRVRYRLRLIVYLGPHQRLDGDNSFKCVADGLKDAGVIHSDARVLDWHCYVRRAEKPRTVITVWATG